MAAQSRTLDFEDTQQAIREKWLRYPPDTITGAWLIARSARNDIWRRERTERRHSRLLTHTAYVVDYDGPIIARERLRAASAIIGMDSLLWLARYAAGRRHSAAERVKACRLRQRLEEAT